MNSHCFPLNCILSGFDGSVGNESACNAGETWVWALGQEDPLEEEMATHSNVLAWKIPGTRELGWLQSKGCTESDTTD